MTERRAEPSSKNRRAESPAANLERFRAMGLDGNPFRDLRAAAAVRAFVASAPGAGPSVAAVADSSARFVQVIGAPGRGKSLFLAAVVRELEGRGLACLKRFLPPNGASFEEPGDGIDVCVLDEAQRLDRRGRRALREWVDAGDRRMIVATHEDLSRSLGSDLETWQLAPVDGPQVEAVFRRRIELAGGDTERFRLQSRTARRLAAESDGSLRQVVELLYRVFESLDASREVTIDDKIVARASKGGAGGRRCRR